MTTLSALAFPFMDKFCLAQFTNIDALRRAQGEALGLLGFGPNECDYQVILSGPHWRLRNIPIMTRSCLCSLFRRRSKGHTSGISLPQ